MLDWLDAYQLPCLFRQLFGVICPGCGCQTAIFFLLRGEVKNSFEAWPPLIPVLFFMILVILKMSGLKKIHSGMLKNVGFFCLIMILISYLLKLTV